MRKRERGAVLFPVILLSVKNMISFIRSQEGGSVEASELSLDPPLNIHQQFYTIIFSWTFYGPHDVGRCKPKHMSARVCS